MHIGNISIFKNIESVADKIFGKIENFIPKMNRSKSILLLKKFYGKRGHFFGILTLF